MAVKSLSSDRCTLVEFALKTAGIPPERIVIFGQSLGTAVSISLSYHLALQSPPTLFAGSVLIAPFANVELLTQTYSIAGTIPLLSPVVRWPKALDWLNSFIISKWPSKDKLAELIRRLETLWLSEKGIRYDITIIHAQDDYDIPWSHSHILFWHAANATRLPEAILSFEELEVEKAGRKSDLGDGWREVAWRGDAGVLREQIPDHGLHDQIMIYLVVSLAVARALQSQDRE
ncbi:uncharacterized protein Z519_11060 [Cladophialophora bantiana CBS 173.52]|uniref:AB hydrolase-1 domain-containing protein n=1 Tax=Cladophialophora bantiana (strain ATCC 10958 / CBS 173.52 / CDC B-1940 / NIH 8579) TaxID=1442370 RepID=A0A0D2EEH6_CLAB1|nr:uncharacterized protein Z519_11060 [Cladophialophora bantiana CBS 173.52]KIW88491.1 hypothetical protein Z519_11060 [Cladophialophora bantiana CBS 173.52]